MTLKDDLQILVDKGVLLKTIVASSSYSEEIKTAAHKRMIGNVLRIPREKEARTRLPVSMIYRCFPDPRRGPDIYAIFPQVGKQVIVDEDSGTAEKDLFIDKKGRVVVPLYMRKSIGIESEGYVTFEQYPVEGATKALFIKKAKP